MLTGRNWGNLSQTSSYEPPIGMRPCVPEMHVSFSLKDELASLFIFLLIVLFLPVIVALAVVALLVEYAACVYIKIRRYIKTKFTYKKE